MSTFIRTWNDKWKAVILSSNRHLRAMAFKRKSEARSGSKPVSSAQETAVARMLV